MSVSGQFHNQATLTHGKSPWYPMGGIQR